jgi:hypothetical protein
MTTRRGQHGWLVIFHPRGTFVARHDSPAAADVRRLGTSVSRCRTLAIAQGLRRRAARA